jgi:hypothetical protein
MTPTPQEKARRCTTAEQVIRQAAITGRAHEHTIAVLNAHAASGTLRDGLSLAERIAAETSLLEENLSALVARISELPR